AAAVESALQTIGMIEPENARVIQISDTLHLSRVRVSEAYFNDIQRSKHLRMDGAPYEFPVDAAGWLQDV
ncbi:MAG: [Fe-S]-binding protein, partial [Fuerstia sp.]|nr:[Fe-S]-binding protein [Fuerstiella sp.]